MFHKLQSPPTNVNFHVISIISNNRTPGAQKVVFPKVMDQGLLTPRLVLFSVSLGWHIPGMWYPVLSSPPMAHISSLITTLFF